MIKLSAKDCEIKTERLVLRPHRISDLEALWPHVSDPELPKWMSWDAHKKKKGALDFIKSRIKARRNGDAFTWVILYEGKLCGCIGLDDVVGQVRVIRFDMANLGYWLGKKYRRQGIMTEAASAVLAFGFKKLKLHKITVDHAAANIASQKTIEKLGFRYIGEQQKHFFKRGRWHDHKIYELLANDFKLKKRIALEITHIYDQST